MAGEGIGGEFIKGGAMNVALGAGMKAMGVGQANTEMKALANVLDDVALAGSNVNRSFQQTSQTMQQHFGNVREGARSYMQYRDVLYDVSRMAPSLGQSFRQLDRDIASLSRTTNLSRQQIAEFINSVSSSASTLTGGMDEVKRYLTVAVQEFGDAGPRMAQRLNQMSSKFKEIQADMFAPATARKYTNDLLNVYNDFGMEGAMVFNRFYQAQHGFYVRSSKEIIKARNVHLMAMRDIQNASLELGKTFMPFQLSSEQLLATLANRAVTPTAQAAGALMNLGAGSDTAIGPIGRVAQVGMAYEGLKAMGFIGGGVAAYKWLSGGINNVKAGAPWAGWGFQTAAGGASGAAGAGGSAASIGGPITLAILAAIAASVGASKLGGFTANTAQMPADQRSWLENLLVGAAEGQGVGGGLRTALRTQMPGLDFLFGRAYRGVSGNIAGREQFDAILSGDNAAAVRRQLEQERMPTSTIDEIVGLRTQGEEYSKRAADIQEQMAEMYKKPGKYGSPAERARKFAQLSAEYTRNEEAADRARRAITARTMGISFEALAANEQLEKPKQYAQSRAGVQSGIASLLQASGAGIEQVRGAEAASLPFLSDLRGNIQTQLAALGGNLDNEYARGLIRQLQQVESQIKQTERNAKFGMFVPQERTNILNFLQQGAQLSQMLGQGWEVGRRYAGEMSTELTKQAGILTNIVMKTPWFGSADFGERLQGAMNATIQASQATIQAMLPQQNAGIALASAQVGQGLTIAGARGAPIEATRGMSLRQLNLTRNQRDWMYGSYAFLVANQGKSILSTQTRQQWETLAARAEANGSPEYAATIRRTMANNGTIGPELIRQAFEPVAGLAAQAEQQEAQLMGGGLTGARTVYGMGLEHATAMSGILPTALPTQINLKRREYELSRGDAAYWLRTYQNLARNPKYGPTSTLTQNALSQYYAATQRTASSQMALHGGIQGQMEAMLETYNVVPQDMVGMDFRNSDVLGLSGIPSEFRNPMKYGSLGPGGRAAQLKFGGTFAEGMHPWMQGWDVSGIGGFNGPFGMETGDIQQDMLSVPRQMAMVATELSSTVGTLDQSLNRFINWMDGKAGPTTGGHLISR